MWNNSVNSIRCYIIYICMLPCSYLLSDFWCTFTSQTDILLAVRLGGTWVSPTAFPCTLPSSAERGKKQISRLQIIQNRCARLIFKKPKFTHSSSLLKQLHWLPVAERIQFSTLVHTFKALNNLSPHYMSSLLTTSKASGYNLRSSTAITLHTPITHTLAGDRAFSHSALTYGTNSLPWLEAFPP